MTALSTTGATVRRPRGRRGEGGRLREEIVIAATELVSLAGDADRLSLRGVAKEVGIAAPSIYAHFADVEHLKMAVVERCFALFKAARDRQSDGITDPAEALLARCRAYCQFALDYPGPYRFMFSHHAPAADPQRPPIRVETFQALVTSSQTCQASGAAPTGDAPSLLAAEVWAALHGLVLLRMNAPHFPWPAPLWDMVDQTVRRIVGLPKQSPQPG
jgi:AcrR family transcriptional regulator